MIFKGKTWTAQKVDDVYILSVQDRASVVDTLTDFVKSQNIRAGNISGLGAANEATLRFYDPETKKYVDKLFSEQMEIANLTGNISEIQGTVTLHLHVILGRSDYTAIAGHLLDANVRGAGEFFVYPLNANVTRTKNEETGLNLYDFRD